MMMVSVSAWSDLPRELPRIIIAGLPETLTRFTTLVFEQSTVPGTRCPTALPHQAKLPIVVHPTGFLLRPFENIFPLPENERAIGSTDGFLARRLTDVDRNRHTYTLLNPFSRTLVELPELDTVIGSVSESFRIHKVLMHSGLDGLVAIGINNRNHPIILLKLGKGVWLPKPRHQPFTRIIDAAAFLGDTLYAITLAENLISFGVAFDSKGIPTVTSIKSKFNGATHFARSVGNLEKDKDALRKRTCDYIINDSMHFADNVERPHIVVMHPPCGQEGFTRKVQVFEVDISAGTWVPVSSGLHGRALFLSKRSSKFCFAGGEIEEDAIYFINNREVFNMRSETISPADKSFGFSAMWVFLTGSF
ncbi:hypothetical protein VPH35_130803 [Triticum aestivum]